ncbi:MAG: hypothetical protein H6637_05390 [Ardenticatenales bacterium]|nr:hypothetical protein [Ardenticatenales bacterium]
MLNLIGQAITFDAFFTNAGVGATGLTVTVDVYRGATEIVTGGSAIEIGDGLYTYTLASGSVTNANHYRAVFKTAGTADQKHVPALWVVGSEWVERVDEDVSDATTAIGNLNNITAAQVRSEMDDNSTQLAAIVADTNELQTDLANGGRLDLLIAAILEDTGTTLPDLINGLSLIAASDVLDATVEGDESLAGALRLILARLQGTTDGANTDTVTFYGLDGSTPRLVMTVDEDGERSAVVRDSD